MSRVLLALCLSFIATTAFANPTVCSEDPVSPNAKIDKPSAATPVPAGNAATSHPIASTNTSTSTSTSTSASASTSAGTGAGAAHATRPRIISPRWQSLLPGMIR